MNVYMCTGNTGGKVEVFDTASYLGFGENCTAGQIKSVNCSPLRPVAGDDPATTIDKHNDGLKGCHWIKSNGPGLMSLEVDRQAVFDKLTIWASLFPPDFDVYVLDHEWTDTTQPPGSNYLAAVVKGGRFRSGLVTLATSSSAGSITAPYEISLRNLEGRFLLIRWENWNGDLDVAKFEISVQPRNPGAVAFAGEWLDKETGLYYHGARYRHPMLAGKFISPDPLGFLGGQNLYAYAHNDPLTYHDPDGQFPHILAGAGIGAVLGGGAYAVQVWRSGDEWSWSRFGIYTGAGALSGAAAAAIFGASAALAGSYGLGATAITVISSTAAGAAGGAVNGFVSQGGIAYDETGDLVASLEAGGKAAAVQAALGAVGGAVGGAVFSKLGSSFTGSVASGAAGGATVGTIEGGINGYTETGTFSGTISGMGRGGITGAVLGAGIGGGVYAAGLARPRVVYQTRLKPSSYPGSSRSAHFREANEALLTDMEASPRFSGAMEGQGLRLQRNLSGRAPNTSPDGYTWHHAQEPGTMQLVPRWQHTPGSPYYETLHPGNRGGYSKWGNNQ